MMRMMRMMKMMKMKKADQKIKISSERNRIELSFSSSLFCSFRIIISVARILRIFIYFYHYCSVQNRIVSNRIDSFIRINRRSVQNENSSLFIRRNKTKITLFIVIFVFSFYFIHFFNQSSSVAHPYAYRLCRLFSLFIETFFSSRMGYIHIVGSCF